MDGWEVCVHGLLQVSPQMFYGEDPHSRVVLALCFGSNPCWKVERHPSLRSRGLRSRFSYSKWLLRIWPHLSLSQFRPVSLSLLFRSPPHSTMLPPPCFTIWIVLAGDEQCLAFSGHTDWSSAQKTFVSSDQRNFLLIFTHFTQDLFCLSTVSWRPDWWSGG